MSSIRRPSSEIKLTRPKSDSDQESELTRGTGRWVIAKNSKRSKNGFFTRTSNITMGVRGADFMAFFDPFLGETEIVVFDGKADFKSNSNSHDEKVVSKGQRGGLAFVLPER